MVRPFVAVAALVIAATSTAVPSEGHAFVNLPIGGALKNRTLPTLDGKRVPLLGSGKANLFVFFRPGQDHSLQTLGQLAQLEKEFAGKPVRFTAVTSDSYPRDEVAATAREAGIAMPILIDVGDALYGELGVALHPVLGITDERGTLLAYQHFLKINMLDVVRGRIQVALGEIGEAEMARLVEPPAATIDLGKRSGAKSRFLLARALLSRGSVEKAIENARAGVALDPTFAPVHAILGKALAAAGQCAEAEKEIAEALRIDAADPTAADARGQCVASR
jgi:tetratricopeptide (TPR) repeat protein